MHMQEKELQQEREVMQKLMMMQASQSMHDLNEDEDSPDESLTQKDLKDYSNILKVSH